jgi:hypothetical protein
MQEKILKIWDTLITVATVLEVIAAIVFVETKIEMGLGMFFSAGFTFVFGFVISYILRNSIDNRRDIIEMKKQIMKSRNDKID